MIWVDFKAYNPVTGLLLCKAAISCGVSYTANTVEISPNKLCQHRCLPISKYKRKINYWFHKYTKRLEFGKYERVSKRTTLQLLAARTPISGLFSITCHIDKYKREIHWDFNSSDVIGVIGSGHVIDNTTDKPVKQPLLSTPGSNRNSSDIFFLCACKTVW